MGIHNIFRIKIVMQPTFPYLLNFNKICLIKICFKQNFSCPKNRIVDITKLLIDEDGDVQYMAGYC